MNEIKDRMASLSSRLSNAHESQPEKDCDKATLANARSDYSISAIADKVSTIDYYLKLCEETLASMVG